MKNDRLKNSADAAVYRARLLQEQNFIDPIIKEPIPAGSDVLDHAHFGEQRCRGVLIREVNSWEGKVANSYQRYIKHLTDLPLPEILRNLADYLEQDTSSNKIHHTALTVDVGKFSRKPADVQKEILEGCGVAPESNSKKRAAQARKLIKEGKLKM